MSTDQLSGGQLKAPRRSVSFGDWAESWLKLAHYAGPDIADLESRLEGLRFLWRTDVPPGWERPVDARLIHPERRYLRTHASGQPKRGSEHELEYEILGPDRRRYRPTASARA
jgi:hypothetical protein